MLTSFKGVKVARGAAIVSGQLRAIGYLREPPTLGEVRKPSGNEKCGISGMADRA